MCLSIFIEKETSITYQNLGNPIFKWKSSMQFPRSIFIICHEGGTKPQSDLEWCCHCVSITSSNIHFKAHLHISPGNYSLFNKSELNELWSEGMYEPSQYNLILVQCLMHENSKLSLKKPFYSHPSGESFVRQLSSVCIIQALDKVSWTFI